MTLLDLSEAECFRLAANRVLGRIAVVVAGVPRVFPINYTLDEGDVVFRTGDGMKLDAAHDRKTATFEVDHADPLYHSGWSVMLTGPLELLTDSSELQAARLLPVRAWAREGEHWVRLRVQQVSGRRVESAVPTGS